MWAGGKKWVVDWLQGLGQITLLARDAFASLSTLHASWRDLLYQIYFVGVKSQSVVLITRVHRHGLGRNYFQFPQG